MFSALRGTLQEHASLAPHTGWRVGGAARRLYMPADQADLAHFLQQLPSHEPLLWLGLGSNLLVRDGGFPGTVILTTPALGALQQTDTAEIHAEAGVPCAKFARYCAQRGLTGMEFCCGIPGTLGGALAMNAGAHGAETWPFVISVTTLDRYGVFHTRWPHEYQISYRHVAGPAHEWFIAARFKLMPGDVAESLAKIKELLAHRSRTQPTHQPNCGSVFRNPPDDYAGRLIEASGLKGFCIGAACVSEKHANFIVNRGEATAHDIEALITHVQAVVERDHGVVLKREVHIVGEEVAYDCKHDA